MSTHSKDISKPSGLPSSVTTGVAELALRHGDCFICTRCSLHAHVCALSSLVLLSCLSCLTSCELFLPVESWLVSCHVWSLFFSCHLFACDVMRRVMSRVGSPSLVSSCASYHPWLCAGVALRLHRSGHELQASAGDHVTGRQEPRPRYVFPGPL